MTIAIAPTNIAILKYWGKNPAWEEYFIPTKSSLSFTPKGLETRTEVLAERKKGDSSAIAFSLNGKGMPAGRPEHSYLLDFLARVGRFYPFVLDYDYEIESSNNFPTAAGFASSASGFAALAKAMAGELDEFAPIKDDDGRLSVLARLGSGSAARSMPSDGGFVEWRRGLDFDDRRSPASLSESELEEAVFSSSAKSLFGYRHWRDFTLIYCKVKEEEKKVKSRGGMKSSVESSPNYASWVEREEGETRRRMIEAVREKDFEALAPLIMESSDSLHRICESTKPPLHYLDETSRKIIRAVRSMNDGEAKAAYTFDAGPNAVVFTLNKHGKEVSETLGELLGPDALIATTLGPGARLI
ncbi:MAG: diphosphomevalonate decarboxylase [Candidatus Micrarchaeota archaeon]